MSLLNSDLTILDFDGTYEQQPELCSRFPHRWIDFRGLRQTSLYCSLASFQAIRRTMPARSGVTLLGSGNYHYVTLALLARLPRPFTLILVDHHTDGGASVVPAMLSCGSWVRYAFSHLPQLARVVMIGPSVGATEHLATSIRKKIVSVPALSATTPTELLAEIRTDDVYLSIDKDVLAPSVVRTNWDQGNLTLDSLLPFLDEFVRLQDLRGADICGELPASPIELMRPEVHAAIIKNESANERLLETLLKAG
jgi:arginase family enzyme